MTFSIVKYFCVFAIAFVNFSRFNCQEPKIVLPRFDENGETIWSPKIVGGYAAYLGEFPGKISIQNRVGSHFCGGTLIDTNHVLTAAHCVTDDYGAVNNPSIYQLMGNTLTTRPPGSTSQTRLASHVFVHPNYSTLTLVNDIAVIRVSVPFNATTTFYPVTRIPATPSVNSVCTVAGWGATVFNGTGSSVLLRVDVGIINTTLCNAQTSYRGNVRAGMFCAGSMAGGKDSCQGDSGGGLICGSNLAGIVSFGIECATPNFPGVYTDVAYFNSWIDWTLSWNAGSHSNIPTPTTRMPTSGSTSTIVTSSLYTIICGVAFLLFSI